MPQQTESLVLVSLALTPMSPSPSVKEKVMVSEYPLVMMDFETDTNAICGTTEYVGGFIHEKRVKASIIYTKAALRIDSKKLKFALFIAFLKPNFS